MRQWSVNPVAVAQLMDGARMNGDDWDAVRVFLEKAYQVADVADVFDPADGSSSRLAVLQQVASLAGDWQRVDEVMARPEARAAIDRYGPERVQRVLPFLVPIARAAFAAHDAPVPRNASIGRLRAFDTAIVREISYLDPVQGLIADCYLICAMIALTWADPAGWRRTILQGRSASGFELRFHGDGTSSTRTVTSELVVDANDRPLYAGSTQAGEAWPGLVEKAFVMQVCNLRSEPQPAHYQRIGDRGKEPQVAARMLAGGTCGIAMNEHDGGGHRPLSDVVATRSDARGVTRHPTIGWTWEDRTYMHGLGWRTTGLLGNHAYAVLGVMRDAGRKRAVSHVVLRNPIGCSVFRADGYAQGTWQPGAGRNGVPEVLLNANGVFALRRDWFETCFEAVGWVEH